MSAKTGTTSIPLTCMRVIKKSAEEDAADRGYHGVPIAGLQVENISAVAATKNIRAMVFVILLVKRISTSPYTLKVNPTVTPKSSEFI